MNYPINFNKVEILESDPSIIKNGIIWFNSTEKLFKTYIDGLLTVFLMDNFSQEEIKQYIAEYMDSKDFFINFEDVKTITIKHNKNTLNFIYSLFDYNDGSIVHASAKIVDANEITFELVESMTGRLFIKF